MRFSLTLTKMIKIFSITKNIQKNFMSGARVEIKDQNLDALHKTYSDKNSCMNFLLNVGFIYHHYSGNTFSVCLESGDFCMMISFLTTIEWRWGMDY